MDVNIPLIVLGLIVLLVVIVVWRSVLIVQQGYQVVVERLGSFNRILEPGLRFLIPFFDGVRQRIDMREQVVPFPPQPVITSDNINVSIDTVIYYQVTNAYAATYEIADPMTAIEQLAVTTLRNIIGTMDMEQALTGRDRINDQLRSVLDEATGRWGIRVSRVELKAIDPPRTVQGAMEQQMKAERDRRAAILTAEGVKQSQILTAEGEKQAAILTAEGQAQSTILKAQGESRAILQVFDAIHKGNADPKLLSYQYIKTLPEIANSSSSKLWVIPTELTAALDSVAKGFGSGNKPNGPFDDDSPTGADFDSASEVAESLANTSLEDVDAALASARGDAAQASGEAAQAGELGGRRHAAQQPSDSGSAPAPRPNDGRRPETEGGAQ